MNILEVQIERNSIVEGSKQMPYSDENEFFKALVTLCDDLGTEVPLWTSYEEKMLKKEGFYRIEMENGEVLKISSYPA